MKGAKRAKSLCSRAHAPALFPISIILSSINLETYKDESVDVIVLHAQRLVGAPSKPAGYIRTA
jgi:hypothetical protein